MDIGKQFLHTMGKNILVEAQKHIDHAMDAYNQHYGPPDDESAEWTPPPEDVDRAVNKLFMANVGMLAAHNTGEYRAAHKNLGAVHQLLHIAGKKLPSGDAERAYPVYQAIQRAKAGVREAGDQYASLMTTEPPRE